MRDNANNIEYAITAFDLYVQTTSSIKCNAQYAKFSYHINLSNWSSILHKRTYKKIKSHVNHKNVLAYYQHKWIIEKKKKAINILNFYSLMCRKFQQTQQLWAKEEPLTLNLFDSKGMILLMLNTNLDWSSISCLFQWVRGWQPMIWICGKEFMCLLFSALCLSFDHLVFTVSSFIM